MSTITLEVTAQLPKIDPDRLMEHIAEDARKQGNVTKIGGFEVISSPLMPPDKIIFWKEPDRRLVD